MMKATLYFFQSAKFTGTVTACLSWPITGFGGRGLRLNLLWKSNHTICWKIHHTFLKMNVMLKISGQVVNILLWFYFLNRGALETEKERRGPWIKFQHHLSANKICCWRNLTLDRCRDYFSQSWIKSKCRLNPELLSAVNEMNDCTAEI